MQDSSLPRLVMRGAVHGAALGLLVGGLESLPLAVLVTAPLGAVGVLLLCAVAAVSFAVAGALVSFVVGWPVHFLLQRVVVSRGLALQLALTGLILVGYLFGGFAYEEWSDGRTGAALFLAALPLFLFFSIFLLSSRLYRMEELDQKPPIGFWPAAVAGAALLIAGGLGLSLTRDTGGRGALESDPRFVVIAVDGLRHDFGGADTPNLDRLAASGVVFKDAITPTPSPGPAVASLLTGLPPLRHKLLLDHHTLVRAKGLLSLTLSEAGYAVGGFVSDPRLADAQGFGYGFQTYDATQPTWVAGIERERIWSDLGRVFGWFRSSRPASRTVDAFLGWMTDHAEVPFFALVHLSDPQFEASPADEMEERALVRAYRERVSHVDEQVGRIVNALTAEGLKKNTVVMVVGTSGVSLGTEGQFGARALTDDTVHVPLIVSFPDGVDPGVIYSQVRIYDVFPTVLEHAEVEPRHQAEALSLQGLIDGSRKRGLAAVLFSSHGGRPMVGLRSADMKYVREVGPDQEWLFDLREDPDELNSLNDAQPDTLVEFRARVKPELLRARALLHVGTRGGT
ncbi:MAG: sulfatase [Myxococcota bacterium]